VVTIEFNEVVAALTAEQFMLEVKETLGITHLLVGSDFALGHGRSGDIPALKALGEQIGFIVETLSPVKVNGEVVSSSQIRSLLLDGNLQQANRLLGRAYSLEGYVVHGEHRGNKLGFPTANLDIAANLLLPAKGVYACRALVNDTVYTAVTNIGVRPTFENPLPSPRVEPHLLDLEGDLYGKFLQLELIEYLRPEKAFDSPQDLVAQVNRDIQKTRELIDHGK
jgi:riboflavin kinase/FMN adenylyltransferase